MQSEDRCAAELDNNIVYIQDKKEQVHEMIHSYKLCGMRILYDSNSRTAHRLSPLAFKMIDLIQPPLKKGCPSPLRYALAKYDSGDLSEAYDSLYELYERGIIFSDAAQPESSGAPTHQVAPYGSKIRYYADKVVLTAQLSSVSASSVTELPESAILALSADFRSDASLKALSALRDKLGDDSLCPSHTVTESGEQFSETVLGLFADGYKCVSLEISPEAMSAPDSIISQYERIFKELIKTDGEGFTFLPFDLGYIRALNEGDGKNCTGCWAYGICSGSHGGAECDIMRKQLECALALSAE